MTSSERLMAAGMPWGQAVQIGTDSSYALTATGSTKAGALVLVGHNNMFATVASNTGALLPVAEASPPVTIYNGGAQPLLVYANGTDTINALSAGASFSVTNGKACMFTTARKSATVNGWIANLSA